jgi:hypothetical protein
MATGMIRRGSGSAYTRLIRRIRAAMFKRRGKQNLDTTKPMVSR